MLVEILFWFFASVLVVSALGVIMVKNPVHAAMLLVLCFFTSANIWLLIEAEFLAVVLVLFVVMMLDINVAAMRARVTRYAVAGGIVAGIVVFEIVSVVWTRSMGIDVTNGAQMKAPGYSNTAELGKMLYTDYVYPFELAAVLLLIAIVAAISLTMRKRPGLKFQNVAKQVAVRSEDRVRIVKVPAERAAEPPAGETKP